jgi:glycosyltransferase domain-containing protein
VTASDQLTILLPLKDRVPYTRRWLDYAAQQRLGYRILIADGGADETIAAAVAEHRARGLNLEYIRYPFDTTYSHFFSKLADAMSRVTTPFVVMADNDDLFVPEGLAKAVDYLAANPGYVACGGQCAVFWVDGADASGVDRTYGRTVQYKCSSQFSTDVADTAAQRLRERCLGANDVFYAVHRTGLMRGYFEALRDCDPHDLFLMEQLVMFLTAIAGKTKQLDTLYIARQQDSPGSSGGAHQQRYGDWYDRMLVPTWSEDFSRFAECATDALARADSIDREAARRIVVDSYKASVAPSLLADLVDEPTVSMTMPVVLQIVRRLVNLPGSSAVRRIAQSMYRGSRWLSHDFVHGTEFRTNRARAAAREFTPVREFLTRADRHTS